MRRGWQSGAGAMLELVWTLARPSSVLVLLLLLTALTLRVGALALARLLVGLALLLVLLPALLPINEMLAAPLEERVPFPGALPARADGVLVLGGALDGPVSRGRDQLSLNDAAERVMAGAALAARYPDAALVFAGVFADLQPHDFQVSPDRQSLLFGSAFANREIVYLGEARSTYEEALLALERLEPTADDTWLLVTSALHMPRALATFETLGWSSLIPYPVDYRSSGDRSFRPSLEIGEALVAFDTVVREWGAVVVYERVGRNR